MWGECVGAFSVPKIGGSEVEKIGVLLAKLDTCRIDSDRAGSVGSIHTLRRKVEPNRVGISTPYLMGPQQKDPNKQQRNPRNARHMPPAASRHHDDTTIPTSSSSAIHTSTQFIGHPHNSQGAEVCVCVGGNTGFRKRGWGADSGPGWGLGKGLGLGQGLGTLTFCQT